MRNFKPSLTSLSSSFPEVFPCSKHYKISKEDLPNAFLNPPKRANIIKVRKNGIVSRIIIDGELIDLAI